MKKTSCLGVVALSLLLAACGGRAPKDGAHYADGEYTASALNLEGSLSVTVTIDDNVIESVKVTDNAHTYEQYTEPFTLIPQRIVEAQSTEVDGVTGATYSSNAVIEAVNHALAQARGEEPVPDGNAPLAFTPGTYTGTGAGYGGPLQASVTFSESGVTGIEVTSQSETAHVGDVAFAPISERIVSANGLEVDAVSGATMSSFGLKAAVLDAAGQAGVNNREAFIRNAAPAPKSEPVEGTWDVVVIGGGGAGLFAAAQATQDGNSVLVIEKNAELGGNTLVSGGIYQATDHSLVWDEKNPQATSAIGFDGRKHDKVRSATGCIDDLKIIEAWNESQFDEAYYKSHEFEAGNIVELSRHGVHSEFLPTLQELKREIRAYLAYAEPLLARGVREDQLIQFSTTNLHIFQTYYGGLRQSARKDEWVYGDYDLIRQFIEEGEQIKPWLIKMGVDFTDGQITLVGALWYRGNIMTGCTTDADGDGVAERYEGNWGSYVMAPVAVINKGGSRNRILKDTSAGELIVERGRVTGVKATMVDGTPVTAHARKGVIVATGGYAANIQKVLKSNQYWSRQYLSPSIGTTNRSSLRGDGIDMATAVGAATVGEGYTQLLPLAYALDGSIAFGNIVSSIFVSPKTGKRYVDECSERDVLSLGGFQHGATINGVRGAFLYITQGVGEAGGGFSGFGGGKGAAVDRPGKEWSRKGSQLAEFLKEIGLTDIDPEVLKETIRDYDMAVIEGRQPKGVGKRHSGMVGSARRNPDGSYDKSSYTLDDANLCIRLLAPSTHHTMGGLKVDLDRRVIGENGLPIPGLYAAGEVTGGFFGGNRLGGNALTEIMASGRIAARAIEKYNK